VCIFGGRQSAPVARNRMGVAPELLRMAAVPNKGRRLMKLAMMELTRLRALGVPSPSLALQISIYSSTPLVSPSSVPDFALHLAFRSRYAGTLCISQS